MPIYEFVCGKCGAYKAKIMTYDEMRVEPVVCDMCDHYLTRIVSKPGFRRDQTVAAGPDNGGIWDGNDYVSEEKFDSDMAKRFDVNLSSK